MPGREKPYHLKIKEMSLKRKIIIVTLSLFFSMLAILGIQIDRFGGFRISFSGAFAFSVLVALQLFILYVVYSHLDTICEIANSFPRGKRRDKYGFLIAFVSLGFIYSIHFLAMYPGIFAFDARSQYLSYLNNNMSEFHPLMHTVLLGSIIKAISKDPYSINHGVAVFVLIQIFLCVLVFSFICAYSFRKTQNIVIFSLAIIYLGLFPPIVWAVLSVTKDTYFLIFFMVSVLLSLILFERIRILATPEDQRPDMPPDMPKSFIPLKTSVIILSVCLGITVTGMCIFRNNCIYAIPFFLIPLLIISRKKQFQAITIGVFIVLFLCYKLLFVPAFASYKPDGREMYSVPIQQMMAVYTDENGVLSDEDRAMIERLIPEEGRVYLPYIADIPKSTVDMAYYKANKKAVRQMYFRLQKNNIKKCFDAFVTLNCGLWEPGFRLTLYPDGTIGYWPITCYEPAKMNSKLPFILYLNQKIEHFIFEGKWSMVSYIFAPGAVFWLFLSYFGFVIEKKIYKFYPLFIFALAYFATFLFGPVALVRYVVFLYVLLPVYLTMFSKH